MIVLAIMAIVLAVLLAKYFGFQPLQDIKITTILLSTGGALLIALLWRMQKDRTTTYDALDLLVDKSGRASLDAHIIIVMAILALWWIVSQTLAGKDVSERMIDVLMIFVIYRAAAKGIDAYKEKAGLGPTNDASAGAQLSLAVNVPTIPAPPQVRGAKMAARKGAAVPKTPPRTSSGKALAKDAT